MGKKYYSSWGWSEVDIEPAETKKRGRKAAKDSTSLDSKSKTSSSRGIRPSEPKAPKSKAAVHQVVTMSRENSRRQGKRSSHKSSVSSSSQPSASVGENHEDEYFYERVETVTSSTYPSQSQKGKEKHYTPLFEQYPSKDASEYARGTSTSAEGIRYANNNNHMSAGGPSLPDFGSLRISGGYQNYGTAESRGPQRYEQPEVSPSNWNQGGGPGSVSGGKMYGGSSHYNTSRDYGSYNGQTNYQGNTQPLNSYGPRTGYTNYSPQPNSSYPPVQVHNPYDTGNHPQNPYTTPQVYPGNAQSSYSFDMRGNSGYTEPSTNFQAVPTPNQYDTRGSQVIPTVIVQITNAESVEVVEGREKDGKKQKKKKSSKSYGSTKVG